MSVGQISHFALFQDCILFVVDIGVEPKFGFYAQDARSNYNPSQLYSEGSVGQFLALRYFVIRRNTITKVVHLPLVGT